MIRRLLLAGALAAVPLLAQAAAPQPPTTAPEFVVTAGQTDAYERQAGMLAQQKGASAGVRSFGQMMVADHTKSTEDIMAAARQDGLDSMPPPPPRPDQQQMLTQLQGASGAAFDRMYLDQQAMVHQEALTVMQTYAARGDRPALKAAAAKVAPVVEHHLMTVGQMRSGAAR